jgi:Ser/Thr protein kinase RdoA (MazF antagonist)
LVVRVSGRSAAALEWELDLLDALAAQGLHVPAAVRTDAGLSADRGVTVQPFLPGRPLTSVDDWRRVVDVLRSLHEITRGWPQRPGFASARDLLVSTVGGDVDLTAMPEAAVELVRRSWIPVLGAPSCLVHGDLGAGNVLVDGDRIALIDWDESRDG